MKKTLLIALFVLVLGVPAAWGQVQGQFAGVSQCWNGSVWVTVQGNCPSSGGGSSGTGGNAAMNQAAYQLGYALGTALGNWLRGPHSDPQAEAQKQLLLQEIARRQAEAERQHREEEARRLAQMYNRLLVTLKLSGLPNLQLKDIGTSGSGLQLKLGTADNRSPGFYVNEDGKWVLRGISGLPGIYTDGNSGGSGLQLKLGQPASASATPPAPVNDAPNDNGSAPTPPVTTFDPSKMTPQQLADVADYVSKLPPDQQQALLAGAANPPVQPPSTGMTGQLPSEAPAPLQQQAEASQAAASAGGLEDASAKARVGFDQPLPPGPAQLGQGSTPALLREPGTAIPSSAIPPALAPPPSPNSGMDDLKEFLFPGPSSAQSNTFPPPRLFPQDPNPPLLNPLREEQKVQTELKAWDDWAVQRAVHINDRPDDYPVATERALLNTSAVQQYAPELLVRYKSDHAFQQSIDDQLQYANEHVAFDYYQGLADAHKQAILAYQAELEKLAAAAKIDKLTPLEDQFRLHPERRQVVQDAWDRVSADEKAAEDKARTDGLSKVDKAYQSTFQLIRGQAAQPQ